jgi:hypothetical protein
MASEYKGTPTTAEMIAYSLLDRDINTILGLLGDGINGSIKH